jgi:hypothetical protein
MELERWMTNPRSDQFRDEYILDAAVLGCLEMNVVIEVFDDYNIENNKENRRRFSGLISKALTKHGM